MAIQPATLFRADAAPVVYRERFTPASAKLQFLSCGDFALQPGAATAEIAYPREEALLFAWRGAGCIRLESRSFALAVYDALYVPRAPAARVHPPHHAEFARIAAGESRIRRLKARRSTCCST
jgi:hypothetical protein